MTGPTIAVIVPAFNAAETLAETLASVAAQTWTDWTCLVVNDGSTDATDAVARSFCSADPRFRLLSKSNGGVASARNLALAEAAADFVAPIDADDVWHPLYLEMQIRTALAQPDLPGLVYAFSRHIDARSRVIHTVPQHAIDCRSALPMIYWNLVGNGSAILIERKAAIEAGGYDEGLRAAGIEGAEDYLLQLRIAARRTIAATPLYLVGYRLSGRTMSRDRARMLRSAEAAIATFVSESGLAEAARVPLRLRRGSLSLQHAAATRGAGLASRAGYLLRAFRSDPLRNLLVATSFALRPLAGPGSPRIAFAALAPDDLADARRAGSISPVYRLDAARLRRFANG